MQQVYKKIFQGFAKLKFAISLLLVIAGLSIIGTIIEQNQSFEFYLKTYNKVITPFSITFGQAIIFLNLDHIYLSWWFNSLLILLGLCLTSCTITQQFPLLRKSKVYTFKDMQLESRKQNIRLDFKFRGQVIQNLKRNQYTIFQQKNSIYAYKGLIGRFAPIIVHGAMLVILAGILLASIAGFQSQELIVKGEIIQTQNITGENILSSIPKDFIRVNDFWIEYGKKSNTKQFYSNISLLSNNGKEKKSYTTKVNYPFRYKDLTFYQTDWNIVGLRVKIKNNIFQIPTQNYKNKTTWISYSDNEYGRFIILYNNLEGYFQIFSEDGQSLGKIGLNDLIGNSQVQIVDVITETGLQIKADPGIPIIYGGFFLLMISTLVSYKSYNQYWLNRTQKVLTLDAKTNRAAINLKRELEKTRLLESNKKNYT
jgi:cytochrome c biogenesis protein